MKKFLLMFGFVLGMMLIQPTPAHAQIEWDGSNWCYYGEVYEAHGCAALNTEIESIIEGSISWANIHANDPGDWIYYGDWCFAYVGQSIYLTNIEYWELRVQMIFSWWWGPSYEYIKNQLELATVSVECSDWWMFFRDNTY